MRILLAPDKFKGSLSAVEVCAAAEQALARIYPEAEFVRAPIADGGEGTAATLHAALGGEWLSAELRDPLGRPVIADYALLTEAPRLAVLEMSAASGFSLVADLPRDPAQASTFGTGQLMQEAIRQGAEELLLGIGGSATNDGGVGMAQALGYRFLDSDGDAIEELPKRLLEVTRIVAPDDLNLPPVRVACDVINPLLGAQGATAIYGPQKGIREEEIEFFEQRLHHLADLVGALGQPDLETHPGAGAAGGLGFGLMAFCGARLEPGFDLVAEAMGLAQQIGNADLVVTGEGRIDSQTLSGKGPAGVGDLARAAGVPCIALCGGVEAGLTGAPFELILATKPEAMELAEAMARAAELISSVIDFEAEAILRLTSA